MKYALLFVLCSVVSGCGLHANPAVWEAHDRIFECEYSHVEPVMSSANQRLAMTSVQQPSFGVGCDHWTFSGVAPRRMVYDCIDYINNAVDCSQFTNRMFECDRCYVSWRDSH